MSPEALETVAERYVLEEPIASGGMATVWKARDEVLARLVALKILDPKLAEDPTLVERFRTEALAAGRLAHPNIVQTFDTGQDDGGQHFIVMEYCSKGTLEDIARAEGALDPGRAVAFAASICDALAYAHRHGVIHRDIKPGNVLVTADGSLKVGDFGIAKAAFASDVTTTGKVLGTVTYLSPEQARGEEPDARSDLYSVGVLLYELLTGRPPFAAETHVATAMAHLNEPPPPPRTIRGGIPRPLEAVVLKALAKDRDDRFGSADEMRAALEAACTPSGTATFDAAPARHVEEAPDEPGIGRVLAFIAAIVLIALLVAYVVGEQTELGERNGGGAQTATGEVIRAQDAVDFDPHGTGGESPDEVGFAMDRNEATQWTTENYDDPLHLQKPGVGLLFDFGQSETISEVELTLVPPGSDIEVRVADTAGLDEEDFEVVGEIEDAEANATIETSGSGRYWLIWITQLPGAGAGSTGIAEVRFLR